MRKVQSVDDYRIKAARLRLALEMRDRDEALQVGASAESTYRTLAALIGWGKDSK